MERIPSTPPDGGAVLERARSRANESRTGMLVFMAMGRLMVNIAANNEPDPVTRSLRRARLMDAWSRYTGMVAARA